MATGLLSVTGTIDLDQFWPRGDSDADTVKVTAGRGNDAVRFRSHPTAAARVTHVFDDSIVRGRVRRPAIDNAGRLTVRLQGLDAPELHYQPAAVLPKADRSDDQHALYLEWNHEYRQHAAEAATTQLLACLSRVSASPIAATIVTAVDEPGDVFDTYGRFVGDVLVHVDGAEVNVNTWLVENGWGLPSFYNSMSRREIRTLAAAASTARQARLGVWRQYSDTVGKFGWDLRYRPRGVPNADDSEPVVLPKMFRRQATFAVNRRSKMVSGNLRSFVRDRPDYCFHTREFLEHGTMATPPHTLLDFFGDGRTFSVGPGDVVFQEASSKLVGPDGREIETWW